MYEQQVETVSRFCSLMQIEQPAVYAIIREETEAAFSGLEYYDLVRGAVRKAQSLGLLSADYNKEVKQLEKAITHMFTS